MNNQNKDRKKPSRVETRGLQLPVKVIHGIDGAGQLPVIPKEAKKLVKPPKKKSK